LADLIATGSIAGASKAPLADFTKNLRGAIVNHRSGLGVLPATLRPEELDLLNAELTTRALDVVAPGQRVIVADLGTSLGAGSLAIQRDPSSYIARGANDIARLIGAHVKLKL